MYVHGSQVRDIGFQSMLWPSEVNLNFTRRIVNKNSSHPVFSRPLAAGRTEPPNGFIEAEFGFTEIKDSTFNTSVSIMGVIRFTGQEQAIIDNTTFERLVGLDQAATIFVIQNRNGDVTLLNSVIQDCFAETSTISLTFARMTIQNVQFLGNFARISSNGLSLIFSDANIHDSVIDNGRNIHDVPLEVQQHIHAGFINMNYQSKVGVYNTKVRNLVAQQGSFVYATGHSSLIIGPGTLIENTTSQFASVSMVASEQFQMIGSAIKNADGIYVENMMDSRHFLIENSQFSPSAGTLDMIKIVGSAGIVRSTQVDGALVANKARGLYIDSPGLDIQVLNSQFSNLTSSAGAGLTLKAVNNATVENCTFFNNSALTGGAVEVNNVQNVTFVSNSFLSNSAKA